MENELDTLRQRNAEIEKEMQRMKSDFAYLSKKHTELAELAETRLNETKALKLTLQSVQLERDKFQQAVSRNFIFGFQETNLSKNFEIENFRNLIKLKYIKLKINFSFQNLQVAYLERRCEALELIGLDQGIVLDEEPLLCMEIDGPLSREFKVRGSKATQTSLTVDALGLSERTMDELQIRLRVCFIFIQFYGTISNKII